MIRVLYFLKNVENNIRRKICCRKFRKYSELGDNFDVGPHADCHSDTPGSIKIGNNCRIYGRVISQDNGKLSIGDNTCIYNRSYIGSINSITIGSCVIISNHVHIFDNNNHPTSPKVREEMCKNGFDGDAWRWKHSANAPIVIEDNVWIGEYSAILKGVTIGKGSIVASHSVVCKDVPPYSVVAGNPAVVVKKLDHEE